RVGVPEPGERWPAAAPLSSAILALASVLVIVTLGVALLTRFQLASTARTIMPLAMALPAVWPLGAPVLPAAVPGAAVSPGNKICSFVTAPALTVSDELVLAVLVLSLLSLAVTVALPAGFCGTLEDFVPSPPPPIHGESP